MRKEIVDHFQGVDELMYGLALVHADTVDDLSPIAPTDYLTRIMRVIAGQQLSVKAASTIWSRVEQLVGEHIGVNSLDGHSDEDLRTCGLSYQKIGYMRSIVESVRSGDVDIYGLHNMTDEEAVAELVKLKGIGAWSAEMFLMSALAREDVFSSGDLGLVTGAGRLYGCDRTDLDTIESHLFKLSPYRSYASLLLWRSLDNEPSK